MRRDDAVRSLVCAAIAWVGACGDNAPSFPPPEDASDAPIDAPPDTGALCAAGLAAWYKLDESDGAVLDACGAHNGAVAGTGLMRGVTGHHGWAISFDGTDGQVVVPSSAGLDFITAGTVELWINLSTKDTVGSIASRGTGLVDDNVLLSTDCGNVLGIHTRGNVGTSVVASDCDALSVGTWAYVAVVNDGTQARLYVNGALFAMSGGGFLGPLPHDLYLGRKEGGSFPLNAALDDVKWWTVARTREEICVDAGGVVAGAGCDLADASNAHAVLSR